MVYLSANYLDAGIIDTLFGHDSWSLRGYDECVQQSTRIQTNGLEYRFPITSVERNWDIFPLGLGNLSGPVFRMPTT